MNFRDLVSVFSYFRKSGFPRFRVFELFIIVVTTGYFCILILTQVQSLNKHFQNRKFAVLLGATSVRHVYMFLKNVATEISWLRK